MLVQGESPDEAGRFIPMPAQVQLISCCKVLVGVLGQSALMKGGRCMENSYHGVPSLTAETTLADDMCVCLTDKTTYSDGSYSLQYTAIG